MNFQDFFLNYGLLILLGALLVFMFWNSSRRMKKQREEQAQKARQTVPGAEVLLQERVAALPFAIALTWPLGVQFGLRPVAMFGRGGELRFDRLC